MKQTIAPFKYSDSKTPSGYVCKCGAAGVRLYREYQTMLDAQVLRCTKCALENQHKDAIGETESSIGWLVAAVPTEEGDTFWGYTSVPQAGVEWWFRLPKENAE